MAKKTALLTDIQKAESIDAADADAFLFHYEKALFSELLANGDIDGALFNGCVKALRDRRARMREGAPL